MCFVSSSSHDVRPAVVHFPRDKTRLVWRATSSYARKESIWDGLGRAITLCAAGTSIRKKRERRKKAAVLFAVYERCIAFLLHFGPKMTARDDGMRKRALG